MKPRISQLAKTTRGQQTAPALRARQDYKVATLGKSAKCVALFLESIKMLQPKTWSRYNTIILVYIYVYCSLLYQNCAAYIEFWPFELMAKIWLSFLWISPKVYQFQS